MFYVVWRWPTPSGSVRGWTRATSAATGSSSGPPPPRWRRWRAGRVSTAARSSPASAASPDMSVFYHCILTVCIVYNAGVYILHQKSSSPLFGNHIFFPWQIKLRYSFITFPLQLAQIMGNIFPLISLHAYHLSFLFSYIIRYSVTFFSFTFGHFTSYIFPFLLFANCNLVYFLLSLPPLSYQPYCTSRI